LNDVILIVAFLMVEVFKIDITTVYFSAHSCT
jgi:hypothetical protein